MFVPLMLGDLMFGADTLSFKKLALTRKANFAPAARVGLNPVLQHTGRAGRSVSLDGVIFPARLLAAAQNENETSRIVGFDALNTARKMAESGEWRPDRESNSD